jgi:hypothetical protein
MDRDPVRITTVGTAIIFLAFCVDQSFSSLCVMDLCYPDHDESCCPGAINPVSLAPFERLCRICGTPNAVIFRLQDKTEVVERVNAILTLNIDLKVMHQMVFMIRTFGKILLA